MCSGAPLVSRLLIVVNDFYEEFGSSWHAEGLLSARGVVSKIPLLTG